MLERGTNRVRLFPVENRNAETLLGLIGENIHAKSTIVSDGWRAYGEIKLMKQQYSTCFADSMETLKYFSTCLKKSESNILCNYVFFYYYYDVKK
jgi:hypothetical protein